MPTVMRMAIDTSLLIAWKNAEPSKKVAACWEVTRTMNSSTGVLSDGQVAYCMPPVLRQHLYPRLLSAGTNVEKDGGGGDQASWELLT